MQAFALASHTLLNTETQFIQFKFNFKRIKTDLIAIKLTVSHSIFECLEARLKHRSHIRPRVSKHARMKQSHIRENVSRLKWPIINMFKDYEYIWKKLWTFLEKEILFTDELMPTHKNTAKVTKEIFIVASFLLQLIDLLIHFFNFHFK